MTEFDQVLAYLRSRREHWLDGLTKLLSIPSISTLDAHRDDVARAGQLVADKLRQIGMDDVILQPGRDGEHPMVRAQWMHKPGCPTVCVYAHFDVQPVEPLHLWTSPPFEPTIRDGDLYARGAADDKGQLWILVSVFEAYMEVLKGLPVNIKVLFEGEEESSGAHIDRFVREAAGGWLQDVDAVLVLDNGMFAPGLPTISGGLRGLICAEITCRGAKRDLHSGQYGGAAPNAATAMAKILASFHTDGGRVRIPGFYKSVKKPSKRELLSWAALPFDVEEYTRDELGARGLMGDNRVSVQHRTWALPTLEVNGNISGFTDKGFKTVIPGESMAKVSMRLVPGMNPSEIADAFTAWVRKVTPKNVTSDVKILSLDRPVELDLESAPILTLARAYEDTFGRKTAFVRSGGSIPIAATFKSALGKPVACTGFTLNRCNEHAPDEFMPLESIFIGMEAIARWFWLLGSKK